MDRKRLIGKILMDKGLAIQSKQYRNFLPIGKPEILAEFYDEWQVDEILLIEKSTNTLSGSGLESTIRKVVEVCRTPLTVCGGIDTVDKALTYVQCGADRVAANSAFIDNPQFASKLKSVLGRQAVVAYIDFVNVSGEYLVYDHRIQKPIQLQLKDFCLSLKAHGVGEIVLHSVDLDGSGCGFDLACYQNVAPNLGVPIVASGGYGNPLHAEAVLRCGVQALSIGNALAFTEHAMSVIKGKIRKDDDLRKSNIHYNQSQVSAEGRLIKKQDDYLDGLRFKKRVAKWM